MDVVSIGSSIVPSFVRGVIETSAEVRFKVSVELSILVADASIVPST
jgi:hypothetical protein